MPYIISLRAGDAPNGSPEGKHLDIDTVSQNRLNATKNHEI